MTWELNWLTDSTSLGFATFDPRYSWSYCHFFFRQRVGYFIQNNENGRESWKEHLWTEERSASYTLGCAIWNCRDMDVCNFVYLSLLFPTALPWHFVLLASVGSSGQDYSQQSRMENKVQMSILIKTETHWWVLVSPHSPILTEDKVGLMSPVNSKFLFSKGGHEFAGHVTKPAYCARAGSVSVSLASLCPSYSCHGQDAFALIFPFFNSSLNRIQMLWRGNSSSQHDSCLKRWQITQLFLKVWTHRILSKWRRLPCYSVRITISAGKTFKVFLMCNIRRSKSSFPSDAFFLFFFLNQ